MFGGGGNKKRSTRIDTLVGRNTRITGDVEFSGGLHVVGTIVGNVTAQDDDSVLSINDQGKVEGEVRVPHIVLDGTVEGDVYATDRIELGAHARVTGNVIYNLIEMAVGATVNGKLVHKPQGNPRLLSHTRDESRAPEAEPDRQETGS